MLLLQQETPSQIETDRASLADGVFEGDLACVILFA